MIQTELPAPASAATTTKPAAAAKPASAPAPTDLQNQIAGLAQTVARMSADVAAQQIRVADLAVIAEKQAAIRHELAEEETDYGDASARLAELTDHHNALDWATGRKGLSLVLDGNRLRDLMAALKSVLLATLNRAAGAAVAKRQAEIATVISKWDGAEAPQSPVAILTIYEACPTCRSIEVLRAALENWRPSLGPKTFLTAAGAATAALGNMLVPEDEPLLQGGPQRREANLIYGWDGRTESLALVASFENRPIATAAFEALRNRTGVAGLRQVVLLEEAQPEREGNLPAAHCQGLDFHENSALAQRFALGSDPAVIAGITAWLALE